MLAARMHWTRRTPFWLLVPLLLNCGNEPQPPTPVVDIPLETFESFDTNADGLPITASIDTPFGYSIDAVVTDVDDPLSRWGQCLGRVVGCYRANAGRLTGCAEYIELCGDNTGGHGCCPSRCVEEFQTLLGQGLSEDEAVARSFLAGDCVEGLTDSARNGGRAVSRAIVTLVLARCCCRRGRPPRLGRASVVPVLA